MKNDNQNTKAGLTFDEAVQVWLLRWQGWIQSAIAQKFMVNQGRVNEVLKEVKHLGSKAAAMAMRDKAA
jgi:transcriptional regulator